MAHPWFTGQTDTRSTVSLPQLPPGPSCPCFGAGLLAREQGRGRDVGLLVALSWEPEVRQQAWRHDCSPGLSGLPRRPPQARPGQQTSAFWGECWTQ